MPIILNEQQTNFLAICNKNFTTLDFMYKSGVFEVRGGNVVLSFTSSGVLKTIKRELFSYSGDNSTLG